MDIDAINRHVNSLIAWKKKMEVVFGHLTLDGKLVADSVLGAASTSEPLPLSDEQKKEIADSLKTEFTAMLTDFEGHIDSKNTELATQIDAKLAAQKTSDTPPAQLSDETIAKLTDMLGWFGDNKPALDALVAMGEPNDAPNDQSGQAGGGAQ